LTARPYQTASGHHAFSDLPFSPRAAFIWNHTRRSVAWMNPAARAAFPFPLEQFSKSLSARLICLFARHVASQAPGVLAIKTGRGPSMRCSVEALNLAGGEQGLIVAEAAADEDLTPLPAKVKRAAPKKAARKTRPAPSKTRAGNSAPPPALTEEEMRAFKAIGRKVRRLCEEKRRAHDEDAGRAPARETAPASLSAAQDGAKGASPNADPGQALKDLQSAFDLVLRLGAGLEILSVEGRPRMGWRKADLKRKSATELLPAQDRALFQRMLKKLQKGARSARETLRIFDGKGDSAPCRVVLTRPEGNGGAYLFAALSLALPVRLQSAPAPAMPALRRMAA
jgi:hypothetical protein